LTTTSMNGSDARRSGRGNYAFVDFARAAAALIVVIGHVRVFVFVDFIATTGLGWAGKAFYFLTGLGHQAVMVFFVLSGFLVGGHVYTAVVEGRWSWPQYFIKRLVRLWIVLLPALALTAVWDRIGIAVTQSPMYFGQLAEYYHSVPAAVDQSKIYSLSTLVENAFFLQTTNATGSGAIPTFGTNGPLWSLSNEFWYYILFPCLLVPLRLRRLSFLSRVCMLVMAAILLVVLPKTMVFSGTIWLMGVGVFIFNKYVVLTRTTYVVIGWIAAASMATALWITRTGEPGLGSDFLVGATFSALLVSLARTEFADGYAASVFRHLASFSYTLYLTHFPLMALVACWLLQNRRLQPSPVAFLIFLTVILALVLYALGLAIVFENHTETIQVHLKGLLRKITAPRVEAPESESSL